MPASFHGRWPLPPAPMSGAFVIALALLAATALLRAQKGDRAGESQTNVVPRELIPPAPVLTPEKAIESFRIAPGFRIETVAAEPLVRAPVQILFDPAGRLWVLEMPGYMPNIEGIGESETTGTIAVLEDTDQDGRMDRRTVFLDQLVMPRAIGFAGDGLLVAEPPNLWFCRDSDGDGRADMKESVATDYATQADPKLGSRANPEHASNGLLRALDNWIYSANHTTRFRFFDDAFQREPTIFRGQWGLAQDNHGRLFYNSNEDPLRADLVPSAYLGRNPYLRRPAGVNVRLYSDKTVWPARVNPGVNRGYRKGQLRPDGTLATFTAACAPLVYRGNLLPPDVQGDVFVCEPSGNLVRRYHLEPDGVSFNARNAHTESEFLASTDERFRPVNLANGPDGALYIVDFHRGLIQHRLYVTTYLRNQILDRGLDQPLNLGRIYRVVPADTPPPRAQTDLSRMPPSEWVATLAHPNGWHRDTAQRLIVERYEPGTAPALRKLLASGAAPLGRLHALWTLEGLRLLDPATIGAALNDSEPAVRAAALRVGEPFLRTRPELLEQALQLERDPSPIVILQLALTLGSLPDPRAEITMASLASRHADDRFFRDAILTGLAGREPEFLRRLLDDPAWRSHAPGRRQMLLAIAQCIFTSAKSGPVIRLLDLAAQPVPRATWQRLALLDGILRTLPPAPTPDTPPRIKPVRLPTAPAALDALRQDPDPEIAGRATRIADLITWPGKPGEPWPEIKPLTGTDLQRFELGKQLYASSCAVCHQPHGMGQEGLAPPLVNSEWVLGPPSRPARILLHGLHGPITVNGELFDLDMPSFGVFDDEQIAAILTYIRREWDHEGDPVQPAAIRQVREQTAHREEAWTEAELLKIR